MLFITGLLTLLALSNAGGDHTKGGGHIKGDFAQSETIQQQITQEEIAPSPYNFNIKTAASFGTKIIREETGDSDGRVKGSYTLSSPRGTTRVVEYHADETGFHANIETSDPNIKTHSPANAHIEVISKKGGSATTQELQVLPGKTHRTDELHHAAVPVAQNPIIAVQAASALGVKTVDPAGSTLENTRFSVRGPLPREPTARPVINPPSVKTIASTSGQEHVKTISKSSQPGDIVYQQIVSPARVSPVRKGSSDVLPGPLRTGGPILKAGGQLTGGAREVIVYEDGTIVDVGSVSGNAEQVYSTLPNVGPNPLIGGISGGPVLTSGFQLTEGPREVIVYEDGSIEEVGGVSGNFGQVYSSAPKVGVVSTSRTSGNVATVTSSQIPIVNAAARLPTPDFKKQRIPSRVISTPFTGGSSGSIYTGSIGRTQTGTPAISAQIPKIAAQVVPKAGISDKIIQINRELIQRQDQEGFIQTFGGVVKSDSDLEGLSISLAEVGDLSKPISAPLPKKPIGGGEQKFKYTGSRVTSGQVSGSTGIRGIPERTAGGLSITGGENTRFVLGNAAGSIGQAQSGVQRVSPQKPKVSVQVQQKAGLGDEIKQINRQLIQRQNEEGFTQTFGGVVRSDSDIEGISISLAEIGDLTKRVSKPVAAPQPRRPITTGEQRFKYTGSRVTSGQVSGISGVRVIPGQTGGGIYVTQGENIQFILGNTADSIGSTRAGAPRIPAPKPRVSVPVQSNAGLSDEIKLINRQLIQKQNEKGFAHTFGVKSDSDIDGVSISLDQLGDISKLGGYYVNKPVVPAAEIRRPGISGTSRITTGSLDGDQKFKYTGARIGSLGNTVGSIAPPVRGIQVVSVPKPKSPTRSELSEDIITLNRDLIQKQDEAGVLQTFGGIVKNEEDLDGISVSLGELGDLSKIAGYGVNKPLVRAPQQPQSAGVAPKLSSEFGPTRVDFKYPSVTSQASREPTVSRINQRPQVTAITAAQLTRFTPARISPQNTVSATASRIPSVQRTVVRTSSVPTSSQSDEIIRINKQLIEKQNKQGFQQTFSGIFKNDANIDGVSFSLEELGDVSKFDDSYENQPSPQAPQLNRASVQRFTSERQPQVSQYYGRTAPGHRGSDLRTQSEISNQNIGRTGQDYSGSRGAAGLSQVQETGISFTPVEQSNFVTGLLPAGVPVRQIADDEDTSQFQVRIDDITQPSSLSQVVQDETAQLKYASDIPSVQPKVALEDVNQEYLQENIPVEISKYVPPINYRAPQFRALGSNRRPIVQEQQKLEQILV